MTRERYRVRFAAAEDVVHLPELERQASTLFDDWLEETGLTEDVMADVTSVAAFEDAQRSGGLWVAESSPGDVVGFALVLPLGGCVHLDELDVLPSHSRRGVWSALLHAVCAWADHANHLGVTLSTFRDVPWNAPFYTRRGFRMVDAADLSEDHVRLVEAERQSGLRMERRVLMAYANSGH